MARRLKKEKVEVRLPKLSKISNSVKVWEIVYEREMAEHGDEDQAQTMANRAVNTFSLDEIGARARAAIKGGPINGLNDLFSRMGL
jgi:hypothetical protein